jgi:ABC-type dipeptide/oligopeptide/nickel transport system permease subunit
MSTSIVILTAIKDFTTGRKSTSLTTVQSWWEQAIRRFLRQRLTLVPAILLIALSLVAMLAPLVAPYDPAEQWRNAGRMGQPLTPNSHFWLGTDNLQRDLLSRLIFGARITLSVGLGASLLTVLFGLCYGSLAGLAGGAIDNWLMRFVDVVISLPTLFIIMLLIVIFGRSLGVMVGVIAAVNWTYPARVFRAEVVSLKQREFIIAAHSVGVGNRQLFLRHILPQLLPLAIVYIGLGVPTAIFAEASLSFLGLGVPAPTPAWGSMLQAGLSFYRSAPLLVILPGMCIILTNICFTLLSSGLRDVLDPVERER